MPSKSGKENTMSLRRSPRAPARVKVKFGEQSQEKRGRKRRRGTSKEPDIALTLPSPANVNLPRVNMPPPVQVRQKNHGNRKIDKFCWICHNEGEDQSCSVCPRVYHNQCLNPKNRFTEEGLCPECRLQSADGTELASNLKRRLSVVLPRVLEQLPTPDPSLKTWSASATQNARIIRVMDLSILQDRLANRDMQYKNTASFLADVKWIMHNCHIVYGSHAPLTVKSRTLVNDCRNELIHLESCVECYIRSRDPENEDFSALCDKPHPLVWAKLKGFPYWPAKVLKVIDFVASVRFFGTHDKSKVAVAQCYSLSMEYPSDKPPSKPSFKLAIQEKEMYVSNMMDNFKKFQYFDVRTKFNPGDTHFHTKPIKRAVPPKNSATKSKRGRKSKAAQESVASNPAVVEDVVDISMELEESPNEQGSEASAVGVEVVEERSKKRFMNNLELFSLNNSSEAVVNVDSGSLTPTSVTQLPSTLSEVQDLELQFSEGENSEMISNPSELLSGSSDDDAVRNILIPPKTIHDVVSGIVTAIDSSQGYNFEAAIQAEPSSTSAMQSEVEILDYIPAIEMPAMDTTALDTPAMDTSTMDTPATYTAVMVTPATGTPMHVINDDNDIEVIVNDQDFPILTPKGITDPPSSFFLQKMIPHISDAFKETYEHYIVPHEECQKIEVELRKAIQIHKLREQEIKENTDLIINNWKDSLEEEKQKFLAEAKIMWEAETAEKVEAAAQAAEKEAWETAEKKIASKTHEHQASLQEFKQSIKAECENEKEKMIEKAVSNALLDAKKKWCKKTNAEIATIKRKQWCAFCLNEACFFCCWNTSYCDVICQQKHWPTHNIMCDNLARPVETTATIPDTEKLYLNSKKSNKNNTNGQPLPTLRLNGQSTSRFYVSGTNNLDPSASTISLPVAQRSQVIKSSKNLLSVSRMPPKKAYLSITKPADDAKNSEKQAEKEKEEEPLAQPLLTEHSSS